jgi:hypothetical protein
MNRGAPATRARRSIPHCRWHQVWMTTSLRIIASQRVRGMIDGLTRDPLVAEVGVAERKTPPLRFLLCGCELTFSRRRQQHLQFFGQTFHLILNIAFGVSGGANPGHRALLHRQPHQSGRAASGLGPVVSRVKAGIVGRAVDLNPVGPVDPFTVLDDRTDREGAGNLEPPALRPRDVPDLPRTMAPLRPRWASLLVQNWCQKGSSTRSGTPV